MLHERDALALDRPCDERLRPVCHVPERRERSAQLLERRGRRRSRRASRTRGSRSSRSPSATISSVGLSDWSSLRSTTTVRLREPLVRGGLQPLVVLPLLQLAVADHDDDASAPAEVPLRPGDPASLRDPHPERAGVRLDPGHADVRMPVEPAEAPQPEEARPWESRRGRTGRRRGPGRRGPWRRSRRPDPGCSQPSSPCSAPRRAGTTTTSMALKLEPRCPEPARLTATSAFSRHMSASSASRVVGGELGRRGSRSELGLRDQLRAARSGRYAPGR